MAVCGYARITQAKHFIPDDVQTLLEKKMSKDTHVSMCDYLIGDDYEQVCCPHLPNGLQKQIRDINKSSKLYDPSSFLWHMIVKEKIDSVTLAQKNNAKDYYKIYGALQQLLMFIMMYPKITDATFIITLLERCDHFKKNINENLTYYSPNNDDSIMKYIYTPDDEESYKKRCAESMKMMKLIDECKYMYTEIKLMIDNETS